jgi:WD40 repeat protein
VSQMALSPRGRYLALSYDEGEDVGRLSKILVIETKSERTIRAFNDLNILINDIEFGPTGHLAIGGKFGGQGFGRVVVWELPLAPSDDGGEPNLKETSFDNPQIIPQQTEVSAVAPGSDSTYFAADGGVWKRTSGAMDYSVMARLPYVRDFPSRANVNKLAFGPGGRTLMLARTIDAIDQNDNESDQSVLEKWELPGHRDLAHVFHVREVTNVGFKPGEPLVVTLTDPSVTYEPARVFRAVGGEKVESISFDPEPTETKRTLVSSDARYVVGIEDRAVVVWDLWGKRKVLVPFGEILKEVDVAIAGPGGKFLVMAGTNKEGERSLAVYRADSESYHEWKRIPQPGDDLRHPGDMSISADGEHLAVLYSYSARFVRIWRVEDGSESTPADLHKAGDVSRMLLSPNGRFLVLTDSDNRTKLLDLSKGPNANVRSLFEDTSIRSVAFSGDDRYLALGAENGTAHVFDTSMPEDEIANLIHTGRVTAMAFSDDGKYLATAGSNPRPYHIDEDESYPVRIWLLRPADLIAEAQSRLAPFELKGTPGR